MSIRRTLSLLDFERIFIEARELGVINIHFLGGEPLLNEKIYELIKLAKPKMTLVSLAANGILLKDKVAKLKKFGLDLVNVSLDSPFRDIHDKNRNFSGAFDFALEGIISARKSGLKVISAQWLHIKI